MAMNAGAIHWPRGRHRANNCRRAKRIQRNAIGTIKMWLDSSSLRDEKQVAPGVPGSRDGTQDQQGCDDRVAGIQRSLDGRTGLINVKSWLSGAGKPPAPSTTLIFQRRR